MGKGEHRSDWTTSALSYIVTLIDPFSKWAEGFPVPYKEAATVARVLVEQVFCRMGLPMAILSDKGKEVDGNIMREICRLMGIDKMRTTSYKASTNACVERLHRTMNSMLGKVVSDNQRDWSSYVPFVMAAYRSTRHESTGYSPNFLMLGRETRAGIDVAYGTLPTGKPPATYDNYAEEMNERMRYAYATVREHLKTAAERYKYYYDLRVRPQRFQVGDKVLYYNPRRYQGRQEKWARKYSLFTVVRVTGPCNVLLQKSPRSRTFNVHVEKCKLFVDAGEEESSEAPVIEVCEAEEARKPEASEEMMMEVEENDGLGALAGCPFEGAGSSPRPQRKIRRPQRYCD
jgi:hypothetical protein